MAELYFLLRSKALSCRSLDGVCVLWADHPNGYVFARDSNRLSNGAFAYQLFGRHFFADWLNRSRLGGKLFIGRRVGSAARQLVEKDAEARSEMVRAAAGGFAPAGEGGQPTGSAGGRTSAVGPTTGSRPAETPHGARDATTTKCCVLPGHAFFVCQCPNHIDKAANLGTGRGGLQTCTCP